MDRFNLLKQAENGFTLVELIMVIVLVGILSVGGIGLFSSRDNYAAMLAKDQLISNALLAQQIALGLSATTNPSSLVIAHVNSSGSPVWRLTVNKSGLGSPVLQQEIDVANASLSIDGSNLGLGSSQTFTWDSDANISDGLNHEFVFTGVYTARVCLSASGFAYEPTGSCP